MTGKIFEDYFSELQADMVAIALEYVEKRAEKIYLYGSYEGNHVSFNIFYKVNSYIVHKHQLNDVSTDPYFVYDVADERQYKLLDVGIDDLEKVKNLCQKYEREMPTEMKLIYDVKKNSLSAKYSYDLKHSNSETLTAYDIFNQWFEEVAKENGQRV